MLSLQTVFHYSPLDSSFVLILMLKDPLLQVVDSVVCSVILLNHKTVDYQGNKLVERSFEDRIKKRGHHL